LIEPIAAEQYGTKTLSDNEVKAQSKSSQCYSAIVKSRSGKAHQHPHVHTKRSCSPVKNMHHSINRDDKTEIEKTGHKVRHIWNIRQYRTTGQKYATYNK
jgi:hypothetical protein